MEIENSVTVKHISKKQESKVSTYDNIKRLFILWGHSIEDIAEIYRRSAKRCKEEP